MPSRSASELSEVQPRRNESAPWGRHDCGNITIFGVVVLSGATTPWVVSPMTDGVTEREGFGPLVPRPRADLAKLPVPAFGVTSPSSYQRVCASFAASIRSRASTTTESSGVPISGQATCQVSGPGGGRGDNQYAIHHSSEPPDPLEYCRMTPPSAVPPGSDFPLRPSEKVTAKVGPPRFPGSRLGLPVAGIGSNVSGRNRARSVNLTPVGTPRSLEARRTCLGSVR
jgi:hypothetical protein